MTPYPTAEQAGPQVLRAPVAAALSSPPPDPLPGLAAALRGLTHEAARFPQLIIIYDQIPDRRRGRGFATGIHLNEALEWSKRPGPPQSTRTTVGIVHASSCSSLYSLWSLPYVSVWYARAGCVPRARRTRWLQVDCGETTVSGGVPSTGALQCGFCGEPRHRAALVAACRNRSGDQYREHRQ